MAFNDVAGNTGIKRILRLALERGRVPHSLIFAGPEGVGKSDLARTLAKTLNCQTLTADCCDVCASCRAIDAGTHPDVMVLTAEVRDVKIEQTRLLKQMAYLRPMMGRGRVFIIEEAENLNEPSANSLLKVLEEPPSFTTIVLVTASPYRLPATIRSRCQTLTFSPIGREEIEEILREREVSPEQARLLALLVEGNLERALELDWEGVRALKEEAWDLFEALSSEDRSSRFLDRFGTVPKAIQEEFAQVIEVFSAFVRDILLLRLGGDPALLLNPDLDDRLRAAAADWTATRALGVLAALDTLAAGLGGNLNKSLLATAFFSTFGELKHA